MEFISRSSEQIGSNDSSYEDYEVPWIKDPDDTQNQLNQTFSMDVDKEIIPESSQSMINRSFDLKRAEKLAQNMKESSSEESKKEEVRNVQNLAKNFLD